MCTNVLMNGGVIILCLLF